MLLNCITPFLADSPPAHSASVQASAQALTMEFSQDGLLTAGDWSCPVRNECHLSPGFNDRHEDSWLEMPAWEEDCFGPEDWSPPACSVRTGWGDWWLEMPAWEEDCFGPEDWSPPACSVRIERGNCWLETSAWEEDCFGPENWSPPACSVRTGWGDWWLEMSAWGGDCFGAVFDSLGSEKMTRLTKVAVSLYPNGGWNSLASANVRTPFAAFSLLLKRCLRVREQSVSGEASSVEVIRKKATSTGWDSVPNDLREHIIGSLKVLWFWKRQQSVPKTISVELKSKKPTTTIWDSLPNDLQANVLQRVDFRDLFRFKTLSNSWKKFTESDAFRELRGAKSEGSFTAIHYYIKNQSWRCSGYDLHSKSWKALPPFSYLPLPDAEFFKEFSVCGHGALMCADVSKLQKGELVVFNPLTGETRALPPLLYPRNPVLLHMWVDSSQKFYKVIVAGSTTSSQNWRKPNCKIMEVFDSSTSKWKETVCHIPGPSFGLSKHQTGVIVNGRLFFISYLEGYRYPRGDYVLAWDMENWRYLENWACPIPFVPDSKSLLQLVENDGRVYLFSESKEDVQGQGVQGPGFVLHRIDEMEFHDHNTGAMACQWRNAVEVRKSGVQEICMYPDFRRGVPDFMCVGFGKGKLCIFNTLDRDGVVYDMQDGMQCDVLQPPPAHQTGGKIFSLNPASFSLHPSFASHP